MAGRRSDGLPHAIDGTQEFLAAILDELRGLRADLSPREVEVTLPELPDLALIHITEPQAVEASEAVKAPAAEPAESAGKGEDRSPLPPPDPDEGRVTKPKPARASARRPRSAKKAK